MQPGPTIDAWYDWHMPVRVRVKRHVDSETVHIPELRDLVGRDVEIVIIEQPSGGLEGDDKLLEGSILWYDDPFGPVSEDWEADQ